jgi:hypothetical protein
MRAHRFGRHDRGTRERAGDPQLGIDQTMRARGALSQPGAHRSSNQVGHGERERVKPRETRLEPGRGLRLLVRGEPA